MRGAGNFERVLFPTEICKRRVRLFEKLRERGAWWKKRQRAQRFGNYLKVLIRMSVAEFAQNFEIIQQHLAVTFAQNLFEKLPANFRRQNRRVEQRIKKTQKRIKSRCALQFDPRLPFRRFENAGNDVRESVVVGDVESRQ